MRCRGALRRPLVREVATKGWSVGPGSRHLSTLSDEVKLQTHHDEEVRKRRLSSIAGISRPVRFATLEDSSSGFGANVRGLGHNNYLGKILNSRVYDIAIETPLQRAPILSTQLNNTVYLKREDLQPVFSFKIRGAYNKIAQLSREQQLAGIVACSAGNHAQGVAMSAAHLGIDAIIVMPTGTPAIKVDAVRKLRGNVKLHGSNYDEAQAEAMRLVETEGRTLIHPFDDPLVIAGQGTIGAEVLKHMTGKPLHAIFVCCGGGGMLAGIAAYIKRVRPGVLVIGVEAEDAAGMTASLRNGELTQLETVGLFADGAAVRTVGAETFRICNELVDDMVTVTTDEICVRASMNPPPLPPPLPPRARKCALRSMRAVCCHHTHARMPPSDVTACVLVPSLCVLVAAGGDQGRLHGDALRARARRGPRDRGYEEMGRLDRGARPDVCRHRLRR